MSLVRGGACALASALLAVVAFAAPAAAHAIVQETHPAADAVVPTAPASVTMRFNEPVELSFGALRVYDSEARRVDRGSPRQVGGRQAVEVRLADDLAPGTYTVSWRVVSADGHPVEEAFVFHVGTPGPRADLGDDGSRRALGWAGGVVRWLTFASLVVLGGAVAFDLFVAPVARRRLLVGTWVVAVGATAAAFVLHGAVAGELSVGRALSPSVLAEVAGTRVGRATLLRLGLLAVLAVVARSRPARTAVVAAVLATPALAGHAATASPAAINVAVDAVHTGAAAAWLGGLVALLHANHDDHTVARFSRLATAAVVVLVVTGAVRSVVEVGGASNLDEPYGRLLLAKVALLVPLLVLGYRNRRRLGSLRRTVAAEVAVGAVVLAVTAGLVNAAPARVAAATGGRTEAHVSVGRHAVHVVVTPGRVGQNQVELTFTDPGVEEVRVLFRMADRSIGPVPAEAHRSGPGRFAVHGRQLSVAGRWELEIVARTGPFEEGRGRLTVDVD